VLLLLYALLAGLSTASAQKNALAGYVITPQRDTLRGKIVDKGDYANSASVQFLDDRTGTATEYRPGDLAGYGIGPDQVYRSQDLTGTAVGKRIFAKRIVQGNASLYTVVLKPGTPLYIVQKDGEAPLLLEPKTYFGLLKYTFRDCPALKFDAGAHKITSYSEKSLQNLVSRYNGCVAPQQTQTSYRRKRSVNYGIVAGASLNRYFYSFGVEHHAPRGHYGWRGAPGPGVFVGVPLGRKLELEWQFLYGQYQGSYTKRHTNGVYGDQPFRFRFSYLNAPLLLRYYIGDIVCLSTGFNSNLRLAHRGTETFMGVTRPFEGYPTVMSPGGLVGAGLKLRLFNRVSLVEGRLGSNYILDRVTNVASFNSFQLLLRTNLNK
jgi:hypothetical protein